MARLASCGYAAQVAAEGANLGYPLDYIRLAKDDIRRSRCSCSSFLAIVKGAQMFGFADWLDFFWFRPADPTRDWSISNQALPAIRLTPFRLGGLSFGDPMAKAEFLGRPDECRRFRASGNARLVYARRGLVLEFEEGQFAEAIFYIGPGTDGAPTPDAATCRPQLEGGGELNAATTIDEFIRLVGPPQRTDRDDEDGETILFYENRAIAMEAEFSPHGTLCVWMVMSNE